MWFNPFWLPIFVSIVTAPLWLKHWRSVLGFIAIGLLWFAASRTTPDSDAVRAANEACDYACKVQRADVGRTAFADPVDKSR